MLVEVDGRNVVTDWSEATNQIESSKTSISLHGEQQSENTKRPRLKEI